MTLTEKIKNALTNAGLSIEDYKFSVLEGDDVQVENADGSWGVGPLRDTLQAALSSEYTILSCAVNVVVTPRKRN